MNLRKIIKRLSAAPEDPHELRRVARALGDELPRERLSNLREFRVAIARMRSRVRSGASGPDFACGYMACMTDVTAEYEVGLCQREDERVLRHQRSQPLPEDMRRGIEVAVSLMGHLVKRATTAADELQAIAQAILGEEDSAAPVVEAWTEAATRHGLLHDIRPPVPAPDELVPAGMFTTAGPRMSSSAHWQRAPLVLAHIQRGSGQEPWPLYVRTTEDAWPAWAYALTEEHGHQQSRAIVDGDIRARSIQPPDRPFRLIYDHPAAISPDRNDPTMRELMARADEKFVVAYADLNAGEVPSDFVPISLAGDGHQ